MTTQKNAGILSPVGKRLSCALTMMLTLAALLLPSSAKADEAWVEYNSSNTTLTFKYGAAKPSNTETVTVYDLNEGGNYPGWEGKTCTSVVFDESFSKARPTTCANWFIGQRTLTSIKGLEYLNTEKVTNMSGMFRYCTSLKSLVLTTFNTENVTDMNAMFISCTSLESLDVSSFNTEKVTNMFYMFNECTALKKLDLSSFNTKNVTDMSYMFLNCSALESLNISKFNTESATDMSHMFEDCKGLKNLDVSSFNTENVKSMRCMFSGCEALESLDLTTFNTENVTDMSYMFTGCPKLATIFASDKFSTAKVGSSAGMFTDCTALEGAVKYDKDKTNVAMANSETGYFYKKKAWTEYDSSKQTLTFKYGRKPSSSGTLTVYDLNEGGNSPEWEDIACTSVVFDESFSNVRPTTCANWFIGLRSLASIKGLEYLNTEKVTNMNGMFRYCTSLKSLDLTTFNTENVTDMGAMFIWCTSLESLDVSSFNTEKVTSMQYMFYNCEALKLLDLSNFNTKNVVHMHAMFGFSPNLATIFASDKFTIANLNAYEEQELFESCASLVGAVAYDGLWRTDRYIANYYDGYFKTYYKVGDTKTELYGKTLSVDNLELTDDKDLVVNAPFTAANVSYSRPMTNKWGTLCVPFEVDATSIAGAKFYALKSVSADMITLTQLEDKIPAGTPMLVNLTDGDGGDDNAASISISASNVTVGTTPADGTQADDWQLVGSFAETEVPDDGYIISKDKFWLASDLKENISGAKSVKTKPMRAWLKPSAESAEAKAHVLSIALDDENEPTAVDAIEALTEDTAEIYDLQGRRLNSLQKGLNIVKTGKVTKKIMVK